MPTRETSRGVASARSSVSVRALRRKHEQGLFRPGQRALMRLSAPLTEVLVREGEIDFDDWDEEELRRGRRRGEGGMFHGPDPEIVPASVARAYERRVLDTAKKRMHEAVGDAMEMLHDLILGADVDDKVKLDAIKVVLERTQGKPDANLNVKHEGDPPWKATLTRAIVSDPGDEDEGIAPVEPITKAPSAKKRAAPKKKVARKKVAK